LTPGRDFGPAAADRFGRLSFATALPLLQEAVHRLGRELGR
jgi:bifunctional pyridoxal-dependent enzyme with beta-cystathionase and maltose regulon repressor activities